MERNGIVYFLYFCLSFLWPSSSQCIPSTVEMKLFLCLLGFSAVTFIGLVCSVFCSVFFCCLHFSSITSIVTAILKVSKYRKQNTKFSHPPKNQQRFDIFSPQWLNKKDKNSCVKSAPNNRFKSSSAFIFVLTTFQRLGPKHIQNFIVFLEDGRTWYFAFDIY